MTGRNSWIAWFATGIAAGVFPLALPGAAAQLLYGVVAAESSGTVQAVAAAELDITPDFTELLPGGNDFPYSAAMLSSGTTSPTPASHVTADVGLPGGFDGGAHGISFSELSMVFDHLPGPFTGFGFVSVPLDLTGTDTQLVGATATVTSFSIVLDAPFSSSLTPSGNPDEWLWAGVANVTVSGILEPGIALPTMEPTTVGAFPFSQALALPLVGTFSSLGAAGTQITAGIPLGTLHDLNLSLPPIDESVDLGLVSASIKMTDILFTDISTAIVYRNATPIPEPGTAALLALGLAGLAARRRR